jgi:hypothetical protein
MATITQPKRRRTPPGGHLRRRAWPGLAAALVTVLLASACDTAQQVPWATYSVQLQDQIDAAAATHHCAALRAYLQIANSTSQAHEKATGFPNDALVAYIQAAQAAAGCPAGNS